MLDQTFVDLEEESYRFGLVLRQFRNEWFEHCFDMFIWPTMGYDKVTEEFIIQVPRSTSAVQYVPFLYKKYKTEIIS